MKCTTCGELVSFACREHYVAEIARLRALLSEARYSLGCIACTERVECHEHGDIRANFGKAIRRQIKHLAIIE